MIWKIMRILISGASGFIGSALSAHFRTQKDTVIRLVRFKESTAPDAIYWNPKKEEINLDQLEGFDAVIHLSGDNISQGRWTQKKKESIFLSRCRDTWLLSQALSRLKTPPKVVFCASAVGFYGSRGNEILTEKSSRGEGFLSDVCLKWEAATHALEDHRIRVVHGRFGIVLSPRGGIIKKLTPLFRLGLGAKLGSGRQWMSWISLEDLTRAVDFTLKDPSRMGIYNFVAPDPVTNAEFTHEFAQSLKRRAFLTIPPGLLRLLSGEKADAIFLASTRVLPDRLLSEGFSFQHPTISARTLASLSCESR